MFTSTPSKCRVVEVVLELVDVLLVELEDVLLLLDVLLELLLVVTVVVVTVVVVVPPAETVIGVQPVWAPLSQKAFRYTVPADTGLHVFEPLEKLN